MGMQARTARVVRDGAEIDVPIEDVAGHSDVAPGRKTDPGPAFDRERLSRMLGGVARVAGRPRPTAGL